ncbi:hypothetical protein JGR68_06225 [Luteimonas sp. MC1750]|nr:hypothetical protein [Luteimonas sp. MC1750]QQO07232.1 hypothetical protein JGR68_06225 [Luteimonas sp. MC1750]
MTGPSHSLLVVCMTLFLAACGQDVPAPDASAPTPVADVQPAVEPPMRGAPDFGAVERLSREAEGVGSTPELATLAALQSVVAQVNGVQVASRLDSLRAGLDVSVDGRHAGTIDAQAFQQHVMSASQGLVLGYEVLSQDEIDKVDEETVSRVRASDEGYSYAASASADGRASASARAGNARADTSMRYSEDASLDVKRGASSYDSDVTQRRMRSYWKVRLRADIAQFRAPEEGGRPKIVVAQPRVMASSYAVGDSRVASEEVARAIRGRLSDTLAQTKRFIVLDREFGDEMQAEIDHINSGDVRQIDTARLGQQLATDLILIPTIERFEYPRATRQLRMSDRQVTSYSGGGRITLRLLNAATGEVVMSDSFDHALASTGPSTLPRVVDGKGMAATMMDALSGRIGTAVVTGIFPVSVVALDGDQVVLSQGGDMLQTGQRYEAVALGDELRDPQTGRSLGRMERSCCVIRIDRVSSQTSYGTIEGEVPAMGRFKPGAIELRQAIAGVPASAAANADRASGSGGGAKEAGASTPARLRAAAAAPAAPAPAEDPDW